MLLQRAEIDERGDSRPQLVQDITAVGGVQAEPLELVLERVEPPLQPLPGCAERADVDRVTTSHLSAVDADAVAIGPLSECRRGRDRRDGDDRRTDNRYAPQPRAHRRSRLVTHASIHQKMFTRMSAGSEAFNCRSVTSR